MASMNCFLLISTVMVRALLLVEADIDVLQLREAADHESCADEQDERQSNFDDDEGGAGGAGAAGGIGAAKALFEGVVEVASSHAERGDEACEEASGDGEAECEGENGEAELNCAELRELVGEEFDEKLNTEVRGDEAESSADQGDEDGFSEELPDDARAARAHGGADGDLFAP